MVSDGAEALAILDRILAAEPRPKPHLYSDCTERLTAFRDRLIDHPPADPALLTHVNAAISIVMAAHFPLGAVPWPEVHRARDWLAHAVQLAP